MQRVGWELRKFYFICAQSVFFFLHISCKTSFSVASVFICRISRHQFVSMGLTKLLRDLVKVSEFQLCADGISTNLHQKCLSKVALCLEMQAIVN